MTTKNIYEMSLIWLVNYITKTYHVPLRRDLIRLDSLVEIVINKYSKTYSELTNLKELFFQFKTEILKHITREDLDIFPTILRYDKIYSDKLLNLSDNPDVINKLLNDVVMKNQHWEFNLYLNSIIELLEASNINNKKIKEFEKAKSMFLKIKEANFTHTKIENEDLYFKWIYLQNALKEQLSKIWQI